MNRIILRNILIPIFCGVIGCAGTTEEQMGSQSFDNPSVEIAGCDDPEILAAVESAVTVAKKCGFHYDASGSENGRVVVNALWRNRPVTLTMRFFRKEGGLYIASALTQPGDVALAGGGNKIEQLFYSNMSKETIRRGLIIYSDPSARP